MERGAVRSLGKTKLAIIFAAVKCQGYFSGEERKTGDGRVAREEELSPRSGDVNTLLQLPRAVPRREDVLHRLSSSVSRGLLPG